MTQPNQSDPTNEQELNEILRDNLTHDEYQYTEKPHRMKQAIIEWHSKQVEEVLNRLEAQAGWYSQLLTDKARHDPSVEDTLIPLTAIQSERALIEKRMM